MRYTSGNKELIQQMSGEAEAEDQSALWDKLNPKCPQEKKAGEVDVPDSGRG